MSQDRIALHFQSSYAGMSKAIQSPDLLGTLHAIANEIAAALKRGNKLLLAGNGGSAADAQHIAAEIVGRYKLERVAWAALALTTDTSALTAIANDYGYEDVFARQVQGLGQRGDVFVGLTTSGRSPNILAALRVAREKGLVTVGFTGAKGESMRAFCDHILIAPTEDTPVVQQIHLMSAHGICDQIEHKLVNDHAAG
ncbi:D-sedoheptulose 7-phosphate isomerase [Bradyrhizobium diazoefficiens]|uniref:D-sedoheptulose 7-phosphate isomerase n=1 Tax=Bradyrhizobium diazoefficiens TaxID=1355477 RepID=UPI00190E5904|nr:D-sedoheptulose 7-phosphate isomerase [Bradyrhizobium diazoefficiens]QQO13551.1 D-sedoheptulose 7-phosphate isomerase [Bradyrhizobium diazoefficiens]